jgi:hypothetical protein
MYKGVHMKIHSALIFSGYVESNTIACVPFHHHRGFDSVEELLAHLGTTIVNAYLEEDEYYTRPCCIKNREEHPEFKRCPECGKRLKTDLEDRKGIAYCDEFLFGNCDSLGSIWETVERSGWNFGYSSLGGLSQSNVVVEVHSYGAEVLWYCSRGQAAKLSHAEKGGKDGTPFSSVLKRHINIRKDCEEIIAVYKD